MKSRRLKWAPSSSGGLTLPHRYARRLVCTTAKLIVEWQRWVKIGRRGDVRSTTAVPQSGSPSAILLDRKRASSRIHLPIPDAVAGFFIDLIEADFLSLAARGKQSNRT
jgi:hypothetical protein